MLCFVVFVPVVSSWASALAAALSQRSHAYTPKVLSEFFQNFFAACYQSYCLSIGPNFVLIVVMCVIGF